MRARLGNNLADMDQATRRGFTDHEHLDEVEIIHMNGRVYDYNLGRFMSVDPMVHSGSQGLNPYSYIMNNPLSGTDPTGYAPEQETIEVDKDTQVYTDSDGNNYVDAGDGSGDMIKVDSISVTKSNGSSTSYSFSEGGNLASISTADIGGQQQIAMIGGGGTSSGALQADFQGGGEKQSDDASWKDNYDITEAPDNISIGGGKSYDDLSEEQKYALHITSETLKEGIRLAQSSDDRQLNSLDPESINAVWYSSVNDKGVWDSVGPRDLARARYSGGENIQFYGDRMVNLLGGLSIARDLSRLKKGYSVNGRFSRQDAFRYVAGHELGHVTRRNSSIMRNDAVAAERNADYFYKQLYRGQ